MLLAVAFSLVGLIWSSPLHRYFTTGIPYQVEPQPGIEVVHVSPQDCIQLYYKYWLFSEVLLGNVGLFANPYEFAVPGERGFTGQQFPVSILFALLRPISPIVAYNTIILLSFTACGVFMALLAWPAVRDRWACLLAGLVFCIMPFRLPQLMAGHPNGVSVLFLPLTLALIDRGVRGSWRAALGAGLSFSALAMTDVQLAYFGAMLIGAFGLWRVIRPGEDPWPSDRPAKRWRTVCRSIGWMTAGGLPGVIFILYVKLIMLRASGLHSGGAVSGGQLSPFLSDLWEIDPCGERRIYIGPYVAVFALAGLLLPFLMRRLVLTRSPRLKGDTLFWLVMLVGGLVLSLSMNPPLNALVDRLPIARLSRTPARAIVISFIALAMLSAQGIGLLRAWLRSRRGGTGILSVASALLPLVCIALVLYDYRVHGPHGINIMSSPSPVYSNIVAETPDARVLAVPIWPGDSAMSSSLFHHIMQSRAHLINGYSPLASGHYRETVFEPLSLVNVGQFGSDEWRLAQSLNVTHVTFHPESFAAPRYVSIFPFRFTLDRLKRSPGLQWIEHHEPVDGFRIVQQPDWTDDRSGDVVSPVGYCIPGVAVTSWQGGATNAADTLSGSFQVGVGGSTNDMFRWRGRLLPSGNYVMALRLTGLDSGGNPARAMGLIRAIGVGNGGGEESVLASLPFATVPGGGFHWYHLPFRVASAMRVGFSISSEASTELAMDLCTITFAGAGSVSRWEAEHLFHAGRARAIHDASNGEAIQLGAHDPEQAVVRGPFLFVEPGSYQAVVRGRGQREDGKSEAPILRVTAASRLAPDSQRETVFASVDVLPAGQPDAWQDIRLPFRVPSPGAILELRIDRAPGALIEVDCLRLEPHIPDTGTPSTDNRRQPS